MNWFLAVAFCVVAYLIGSIPFSWLFVKAFRGVDLRAVGSGNLGSTNAMRVLGWKLGLLVQALDILKGFLPVYFLTPLTHAGLAGGAFSGGGLSAPEAVRAQVEYAGLAMGLAAVLGHMFPIYLRFRGGKGVNTSLGVFFALTPLAMLVSAVAGVSVIAATRIVSIGSITGAVVLPLAVWYFYPARTLLIVVAALVALLVIYLHRSNIRRLLAGVEPRIGQRVDLGGTDGQRVER